VVGMGHVLKLIRVCATLAIKASFVRTGYAILCKMEMLATFVVEMELVRRLMRVFVVLVTMAYGASIGCAMACRIRTHLCAVETELVIRLTAVLVMLGTKVRGVSIGCAIPCRMGL